MKLFVLCNFFKFTLFTLEYRVITLCLKIGSVSILRNYFLDNLAILEVFFRATKSQI